MIYHFFSLRRGTSINLYGSAVGTNCFRGSGLLDATGEYGPLEGVMYNRTVQHRM